MFLLQLGLYLCSGTKAFSNLINNNEDKSSSESLKDEDVNNITSLKSQTITKFDDINCTRLRRIKRYRDFKTLKRKIILGDQRQVKKDLNELSCYSNLESDQKFSSNDIGEDKIKKGEEVKNRLGQLLSNEENIELEFYNDKQSQEKDDSGSKNFSQSFSLINALESEFSDIEIDSQCTHDSKTKSIVNCKNTVESTTEKK